MLFGILFDGVFGDGVVLQTVVVLSVDDFFVGVALLFGADVEELLGVDLGGVGTTVLQVVGCGHFHPIHLDVVVLVTVNDELGF